MELLLVVFWAVAACSAGALFGRSVLGELNRSAWERKEPLRFQLADFFCLMVQMQLGMGVVIAVFYSSSNASTGGWALAGVTFIVVVLWLAAIKTMSAAGVTETKRRVAFVLVLLPLSLLLISVVIIYVALLPMAIAEAIGQRTAVEQWAFFAFPLGGAIIGTAWYALRLLALWILRGTASQEDVAGKDMVLPPQRTP